MSNEPGRRGPARYASLLEASLLGADGMLAEVSAAGVTGVTGVAATSNFRLPR